MCICVITDVLLFYLRIIFIVKVIVQLLYYISKVVKNLSFSLSI